ncbi:hypothetical protein FZI85_11075 [Mycobacterium sp. CBMA293]|nr:hypothetical protein [Mycolicibacterium sp. CBMA 360]MUL59079.1 hypothetical protein [Mycolicibacterium sp. CBMA 335]MUL69473.1 hypothetical protein [Mycolicibacterium sp. CBMA 311]MUL94437.1 hypothetical protein [Mycolicibacterium sp. CBMA 230]MUM06546.1 hypothetical protein [Mycolicibacterium sp. CBMA 213]MUM11566.1 hypothetical protein [Mycolicibacterium sp. CBMA 293]MUM32027.1 hypothetical protein [Mycolicibacterium sp. CBMA 361]
MKSRSVSALSLAALSVTAVISAPAAYARPTCQDPGVTGIKAVCQTNGSVSLKAVPSTVAPPANMPVHPWQGVPGATRHNY